MRRIIFIATLALMGCKNNTYNFDYFIFTKDSIKSNNTTSAYSVISIYVPAQCKEENYRIYIPPHSMLYKRHGKFIHLLVSNIDSVDGRVWLKD